MGRIDEALEITIGAGNRGLAVLGDPDALGVVLSQERLLCEQNVGLHPLRRHTLDSLDQRIEALRILGANGPLQKDEGGERQEPVAMVTRIQCAAHLAR